MSEGTVPVSPRLIKANLRRLVGGHVRAERLGHYLDFDVVVIPPGRHVTEFPTADAAFHPYDMEPDWEDDGRALEIRVVPWVIFKISANEPLARKLSAEAGGFWRAGVEQIWELRAWNRTVALHVRGKGSTVYTEGDAFPPCPVLPDLAGMVADLFAGGEDEEALPQGGGEKAEAWRISQRWEHLGERRLEKSAPAEFVPAPPTAEDAADPYRQENRVGGFRGVAEAVFGNWTGRLIAGGFALVLLTTMIYLILETLASPKRSPRIESAEPGTVLSPAARFELAKATVRAYFSADDPLELLELVRHPEETRERILRYYADRPVRNAVVSVFGTPRNLRVGDLGFLVLPTYVEGRQSDIYLEEFGDAGYLVDWESEVGYNATSFPVFRTTSDPEPTVFRVFASESDIYSGAFSSAEDHFSVQLHFPESGESAQGYIARGHSDFPALENAVTGQYRQRIRLLLDLPPTRRAPKTRAEEAPDPATDPATPRNDQDSILQVRIVGLAGDSWLAAE